MLTGILVSVTLLDDGLVLIAGGQNTPTSAELYDPVADKSTTLPPMVQGHATNFTATKLMDGRVLILAGPQRDELLHCRRRGGVVRSRVQGLFFYRAAADYEGVSHRNGTFRAGES